MMISDKRRKEKRRDASTGALDESHMPHLNTGQQLLVCMVQDTIQGRPLTLYEKYCLESRHIDQKGKRSTWAKDLPRTVEFAIAMKVMVTENVEIDLDLTNGARGEIDHC